MTNNFKREKKRTINRTPPAGLSAGLGALDENDTKASIQKVFETETGVIELNNNSYNYKMVTIPNDKILSSTAVDDNNERKQEWLNPFTVRDLINSIKSSGSKTQTNPALGYIDNDLITIVDGSRRRMACHFAGVDFKVMVIDHKLDDELARSLSSTLNVHRHISLLEKGVKYALYKKQYPELSEREIANDFADTQSNVNIALRSQEIEPYIIESVPYPSEISRRLLTKLIEFDVILKKMGMDSPYQIEHTVASISREIKLSNDIADNVKNREFVEAIFAEITTQPIKNKRIDFVPFGDRSKLKIVNTKKQFKLELKNTEDAQSLKLISELTVLLKKHGIEY